MKFYSIYTIYKSGCGPHKATWRAACVPRFGDPWFTRTGRQVINRGRFIKHGRKPPWHDISYCLAISLEVLRTTAKHLSIASVPSEIRIWQLRHTRQTLRRKLYRLFHNAKPLRLPSWLKSSWLQQWRHHGNDCRALRSNWRDVRPLTEYWHKRKLRDLDRSDSGGYEDWHLQGTNWAGQFKR